MDLTIKKLTLKEEEDFFHFFDKEAFTDNPAWSGCYCTFYHNEKNIEEWQARTKEDNRQLARDLLKKGILKGYLAYSDNQVAGWMNVNRKGAYPLLKLDKNLESPEDAGILSIVCYVIHPLFRRQGVARALLANLIEEMAKEKDPVILEAYPRKNVQSDAYHYHGPSSLYEKSGFRVYREIGRAHV